VKVVAHRGASARWPEHTRAAMLQAIADGADGLECDVRLTADDRLVCWHDATVDRTSDARGTVRSRTLEQMRALDVVSWHGGPRIPAALGGPRDQLLTLEDLLDLVADAGRPLDLAIELKHPAPYRFAAEDAVLEVLADRGWDPQTGALGDRSVSLMSFHPGAVRRLLRDVGPGVAMALLETPSSAVAAERTPAARAVKAAYLRRVTRQSAELVTSGDVLAAGPGVDFVLAFPDRVQAWVKAGRLVRVWTVDTAEDLAEVLAVGAHEVTTNVPARVIGLLAGTTPPAHPPVAPPAEGSAEPPGGREAGRR
jgi:glycerophosphoryl diester phosphodiesterase